MTQYSKKQAISLIEICSVIFILLLVYFTFIQQLIADIKYSDMKKNASETYILINDAAQKINSKHHYIGIFNSEHDIIKKFSENLETESICENAKKEGCWSDTWLWENLTKRGIKLKTGEFIIAELASPQCKNQNNIKHTCGALYIDTNGEKKPNKIGKDIIKIYITSNGLIPAGIKSDKVNVSSSCNLTTKFSFGCSARLLGIK